MNMFILTAVKYNIWTPSENISIDLFFPQGRSHLAVCLHVMLPLFFFFGQKQAFLFWLCRVACGTPAP